MSQDSYVNIYMYVYTAFVFKSTTDVWDVQGLVSACTHIYPCSLHSLPAFYRCILVLGVREESVV